MVGYDDKYNQIVTGKMKNAIRSHATNIDRLNGSGVSVSRNRPVPARRLFAEQDQTLQEDIQQTITPRNVYLQRMRLNLGAGKIVGGAQDYDDDEEEYDDGYDNAAMTGGGADDDAEDDSADAPETFHQLRGMVHDYREKRLTGGGLTGGLRKMLPHGKKGHAVSLSKLLQNLRKRGNKKSRERVDALFAGEPKVKGKGMSGGGAGDDSDDEKIRSIHDAAFSGGSKKMKGGFSLGFEDFFDGLRKIIGVGKGPIKGGYAPVAPTTESLAGYDNRNQPRGLMPPPSVNQQPGMRGGALPLPQQNLRVGLAKQSRPVAVMASEADPLARNPAGGAMMVPDANKRGNIGGRKCCQCCNGTGRFAADGDFIGDSTGAIIPNLQSRNAVGSGRSARGAAVSRIMREKGLSLGEASKYVKEHGY
jgi:hypothetical protein